MDRDRWGGGVGKASRHGAGRLANVIGTSRGPETRGVSQPHQNDTQVATDVRIPGLDGIRAVAIAAVLLFHAGVAWFGGGMLGVDVFFALSGFLITTLLVSERRRSGRVRLGRFYERRARRLLPALFVLVIGVAAYAHWVAGADALPSIRGDALSTIGYVSNWRFILTAQDYFVHFGPLSPLLHTWSLAVEEQFYLLWPLVTLLVMRRGGPRRLALVAGLGAMASLATSAALYHAGAGSARLYYATDTRAQAILVGACLGALMAAPSAPGRKRGWIGSPSADRVLAAAGVAGTGFLVWAVHAVTNDSPLLYQGGFFLVALATAPLIVVVVRKPQAALARALSWGPVRYIGRISYGLYLYHWPLFLALDHRHTGLTGFLLLAVRLLTTFAVAVVSFHLVEQPIRTRRLPRRLQVGIGLPFAAVATTALVVATSVPAEAVAPAGAFVAQAGRHTVTPSSHHTIQVLLLGDSMGLTLGQGLSIGAMKWGVHLLDHAQVGCDLDAATVNIAGTVTRGAPGCIGWRKHWAQEVARVRPDVVAISLGRWEVFDHFINGHWTHVGEPAWDSRLESLLDQAIDITSAHGTKVALFTLPYVQQTTEQPNGQPWDYNQPVRTDEFNALLRRVARHHLGTVGVIDINQILDPNGHYTSSIDGVRVRMSDEEHVSVYGGMFLRPTVLPQLVGLASPGHPTVSS